MCVPTNESEHHHTITIRNIVARPLVAWRLVRRLAWIAGSESFAWPRTGHWRGVFIATAARMQHHGPKSGASIQEYSTNEVIAAGLAGWHWRRYPDRHHPSSRIVLNIIIIANSIASCVLLGCCRRLGALEQTKAVHPICRLWEQNP